MTDLIKRLKGVQLRGNTHPRDAYLLEEIAEYIRQLEFKLAELE